MARSIHDVAVILAARTGREVAELRSRLVELARSRGIAPLAFEFTVVDDDAARELLRAGAETTPATAAAPTPAMTVADAVTTAHHTRRGAHGGEHGRHAPRAWYGPGSRS